ncbi:hypothetical protein GY45DRAFT_1272653 [Cubamyces sp. BRFM 1775]|nr:hypothetical protein GY45DRAFT_1272653 [Cubamyces sp. BRFM 1775]
MPVLQVRNANVQDGLAQTEHDMAIRLERLRVQEALTARDVAVKRLAEACAALRDRTATIIQVRNEKEELEKSLEQYRKSAVHQEEAPAVEGAPQLTECLHAIEQKLASLDLSASQPVFMPAGDDKENERIQLDHKQELADTINRLIKSLRSEADAAGTLQDVSNAPTPIALTTPLPAREPDLPESPWTPLDADTRSALPTANTAEKIEARYSVLAALPLPSGIPDDALTPIVIPAPHTLHDFITTTSGLLRSQIGNYRVFQQSTTTWCPEREEHGYYLTPIYKCSTNPRVNTAHRWSAVDIAAKLDKPTECFFNKDGKWYYAGTYKSFRLEDLCPQEWECLSTETSHALIRETLAGRKNTSPQNVYETGQLYSAGALRVACIGLQCIGFNDLLYRGLLDHAAHCTLIGKWRAAGYGHGHGGAGAVGVGSAGLGLGGGGSPWNPSSGPTSPPAGLASPAGGFASLSGSGAGAGMGNTPGSPVTPFGSPGQRIGRVPGLVSVPPSLVRNAQSSD